jgi:hypothetical protein
LSQKVEKEKQEEGFCFYDRLLFLFCFFLSSIFLQPKPRVTPLCQRRDKKVPRPFFFFFFLQLPPLPSYHCNHQKT